MHTLLAETSKEAAWLAPFIIVIGVVGLAVLMMISIRGKVARRQADTPSARERIEQVKARSSTAVGGHQSAAEVDTMKRVQSLAATLDNKAARLEALIQQADTRLAELKHQLRQVPPGEPGKDDAELIAALDRANHRSASDIEPSFSGQTESPPDNLSASVYEMADRGMSPLDIARQLDEQLGKVELILALRTQR